MVQLLLTYIVFAFSACGLGKLYLFLIRQGQLLSFMQKPLKYFENRNEFIYKSIGGCDTCTIQRFADVSFVVLVLLNPIRFHHYLALTVILWFFIYCLFGGMVFYATALIYKDETPKKTTKINFQHDS